MSAVYSIDAVLDLSIVNKTTLVSQLLALGASSAAVTSSHRTQSNADGAPRDIATLQVKTAMPTAHASRPTFAALAQPGVTIMHERVEIGEAAPTPAGLLGGLPGSRPQQLAPAPRMCVLKSRDGQYLSRLGARTRKRSGAGIWTLVDGRRVLASTWQRFELSIEELPKRERRARLGDLETPEHAEALCAVLLGARQQDEAAEARRQADAARRTADGLAKRADRLSEQLGLTVNRSGRRVALEELP